MPPKKVDRSEKRRLILAAAEKVFSRKGFHSTKIEDIANEADIGKGTIYQYFKNREELPLALFIELSAPLVEASIEDGSPDPVDSVVRTVTRSLEGIDRFKRLTPMFLGLFAEKRLGISTVLKAASKKMFAIYAKRVASVIEKGQKAGKISREIDARAFGRMLVSVVDGIALHYLLFDQEADYFATQVAQLERMIRAALEERK